MSENKVEPKPERPEFIMSIKTGCVYRVAGWAPSGRPICLGNECDYSFEIAHDDWRPHPAAQSPQNMAQADIDAAQARIKALEADAARLRAALDAAEADLTHALGVVREYRLSGAMDADPRSGEWTPRMQSAWDVLVDLSGGEPRKGYTPTPAPTQGGPGLDELRAAFVDALARNQHESWRACLSTSARDAADALAVAARERRKGV